MRKSKRSLLTIDGVEKTILSWAEESNLDYKLILARLRGGKTGRKLIISTDESMRITGRTVATRKVICDICGLSKLQRKMVKQSGFMYCHRCLTLSGTWRDIFSGMTAIRDGVAL